MATNVGGDRVAAPRPTGTVTFLFSDIEGSTTRWERDRSAMESALRRHDALLRAAIESNRGYVFKTAGDAFYAAFSAAPAAMTAAADAQRALGSESFSDVDGLSVRMAVHTGHTDERDGDYFGPAVNRVARLLAIGHGGQVLVSGTTADLIQGDLPSSCSLLHLGAHRLKDLARPEEVYQLAAPGLQATFPALRSLESLPNNLPPQLTSFVGRDAEISEIRALLDNDRLATLVGAGGCGKTRAALQVGAELLDRFEGGVWFVELAPIADGSLVATTIAHVLGVAELPNRPLVETLIAHIKKQRMLLILDNCEHVIDEVRAIVAAIVRSCADVHVLATSREGLNISGERVYRVPSLAVPPPEESITADEAGSFGSVALFVDRARASDARFTLTDENAVFVAEIARRLDGIPLALELAAARTKMLAPRQLSQKLDERFRLLRGGDRSAMPRQQTMRALIDWSYDLLSADERALFRSLSIFAGSFALDSASTVCASDGLDELEIFDLLSSLVDKSLVQVDSDSGESRYRLLESTRQYAREKSLEAGEAEALAGRHAVAYLDQAERFDADWENTPERAWLGHIARDLENWRAALEWSLTARNDIVVGQRLSGALRHAWVALAATEGRRWIQTALDCADDATPRSVVARLYLALAQLDASLKQFNAAHDSAERAREQYVELNDALGTAEAQRWSGSALLHRDRAAGEVSLQAALAAARTLGARKLAGEALQELGRLRHFDGDTDGARAYYAEAVAIFKSAGADRLAAGLATNLGELEFGSGNVTAALVLAEESLSVARALRDPCFAAICLCNMAAYKIASDDFPSARLNAREALQLARPANAAVYAALAIQHLATIAALTPSSENASESAAKLLGYADASLLAIEVLREHTERQEYDRALAALRTSLGSERVDGLLREGLASSEDAAVAHALLI